LEAFVKEMLPETDPERLRLQRIEHAIFGAWDRDHPGEDAPAYVEGSKDTPQINFEPQKGTRKPLNPKTQ